ncbi:hypothetical protein EWB00_005224, partial [Schistosoma japonicum]
PKTVVCDVTEIFHQPCPPTEVASSSIRYFGDKSQLWRYLEDRLTQSTTNSIDIEELCPFGCNKKQAAFVFITLLDNDDLNAVDDSDKLVTDDDWDNYDNDKDVGEYKLALSHLL